MRHLFSKLNLSSYQLLPLLMVILLDVAGIILVLPVLTPLILSPSSHLIPITTSVMMRDFLYGFTLALFPFFMFFSTPILGDLSDKFGRKKILLLCLLLSAVSYFVATGAILMNNLYLLIFSRVLAGLAAGTQPIATAAIIDMSKAESKTNNLAWVVFTSSLGLVLGPAMGGLTAENHFASWFGYDTPFLLSGILCLLNAVLLYFSYHDKSIPKSDQAISVMKGFTLFMGSFKERTFGLLSLIYFCFILGWSLYYQTINWLLLANFHYSVGKLGLFVAYIGVIFAISTGIIVKLVLRIFNREATIFLLFMLMMAIGNLGAAVSISEIGQWLWCILIAMGDVICFTMTLTLFSNLAREDAQGWVMGVTGAIGGLTWTVGGLIAGPLGYLSLNIPFLTAGGLCLLSFIGMIFYKRMKGY